MTNEERPRSGLARTLSFLMLAALIAVVLVWFSSRAGGARLHTQLVETAVPEQGIALWLDVPMTTLRGLEQEAGLAIGVLVGDEPRFTKLLDKALEALVLIDTNGVASVEIRFHPATAALTKALGIVTAEPWLRGGHVELGSKPATVGWRKSGRWVADRWLVRRQGFKPLIERAESSSGDSVSSPVTDAARQMVMIAKLGGLNADTLWGLFPIQPGGAVRLQRLDDGEAIGSNIEPWWTVQVADLARGPKTVLKAAQRQGLHWQVLTWLDSPVVVDDLSVSIDLPRAASLESREFAQSWPLPAERLTKLLAAKLDERELDGSVKLRSLSAEASGLLESERATFEAWAHGLPDGGVAAIVDLAALAQWAVAIHQMERAFGAPSSLGRAEVLARQVSVGTVMDQQGLLVHWQEPLLIMRKAENTRQSHVGGLTEERPLP